MMKRLILFGLVCVLISSCTMHREAAARRKNYRDSQVWHGWSKNDCPQAYDKHKRRN